MNNTLKLGLGVLLITASLFVFYSKQKKEKTNS